MDLPVPSITSRSDVSDQNINSYAGALAYEEEEAELVVSHLHGMQQLELRLAEHD
jgi:hypothetical protein